jgi:chaperone modulatory protein CbpM
MKTLSEVVVLVGRVDRVELHRWVELGWIVPERAGGEGRAELAFSEIDIARVRLICDLRHDLAVEEETMPLVLSLLDQLYSMRRQMKALTGALRQQPDEVQRAVMDLIDASRRRGGPLG